MSFGSRTGPATLVQEIRFADLWDIGCIACRLAHGEWVAPEMDHRNVGDFAGMKRTAGGHDDTLPLCCWHHRGIPWDLWTADACRLFAGPSKQLHKRQFIEQFGTIDELYAALAKMLEHHRKLTRIGVQK